MFTKFNVSTIKYFFTYKSKGESVWKLGVWFTSSNQGFKFESKMTSNLFDKIKKITQKLQNTYEMIYLLAIIFNNDFTGQHALKW